MVTIVHKNNISSARKALKVNELDSVDLMRRLTLYENGSLDFLQVLLWIQWIIMVQLFVVVSLSCTQSYINFRGNEKSKRLHRCESSGKTH